MYQEQESSPEDMYRDKQNSPYGAYEGFSSTHDNAASSYGQGLKIGIPTASRGPSWEYRLGLIITSMIFWIIFFFVVVFTIANISGNVAFVVDPLLLIGLIVFTVLVVGANLLFNRKR